jgi:hypothetical protein
MTRFVKMALLIHEERVSDQLVVSVDLTNVTLSDWCLNLCLLKEGLVDALVLSGNRELEVQKDQSIDKADRAKVNIKSSRVQIVVHPIELDYWLSFFLKYYRDGIAEVDHLDVEAIDVSKAHEQLYVVFQVRDAAPPVSAEEARRRLKH